MTVIAIIASILFLLWIQKMIYRRYWYKDLDIDINFEERSVVEQEPIIVKVKISNYKFLPLPYISCAFSMPACFREADSNDNVLIDSWSRNELFSVFSHQSAERKLTFICPRRGVYNLEEYEIINYSFFLDEEYSLKFPVSKQIMVYPIAVNQERFLNSFQTLYGSIICSDFHYEDVFTSRGIREYQPFDSQKRINWTATAKLGKLMVNDYEYTTNRKVVIFLNLSQDLMSQERIIGEESIRLAKTWCMELDKKGIQCSLFTNGTDKANGKYITVEKEKVRIKYMQAVNEALARIVIKEDHQDFFEYYRDRIAEYEKEYLILFISAYQREDFQSHLLKLQERNASFTWIVPVNTNSDFRPASAIKSRTIAWDVYWRRPQETKIHI